MFRKPTKWSVMKTLILILISATAYSQSTKDSVFYSFYNDSITETINGKTYRHKIIRAETSYIITDHKNNFLIDVRIDSLGNSRKVRKGEAENLIE